MNNYKRSEVSFSDYPGLDMNNYPRMSFGTVLSLGAACALIATQDYHKTDLSAADIDSNVIAIEQCEEQIEENVKSFNKVTAAIVRNTNTLVRQSLLDELLSFKSLVQSWDGYGALPTSVRSAAITAQVINQLSIQAINDIEDFYPNTNGSVSFKWTNVLGERLSLSVGADSFSYYCKRNGVAVEMWDNLLINDATLKQLNEDIQSVIIANV